MRDITVINDSQQSELVTNGLAKNGELYLKAAGSTDAGAIVVYDSGSWRTFANEASSFANQYSVSFDGTNDYVGVASDPGLDVYSTSLWFKTAESSFSLPIAGFGKNAYARYGGIRFIPSVTGRAVEYNDGYQYIAAGGLSNSDVFDDAWHHVAIVFVASGYQTTTGTSSTDGKGYKIFIDGTRVDTVLASTSHSYALATTSSFFAVGKERTSYYTGLIDEVAIFGSSLSDSDITDIYNSGVPTDLSSYSPTLWWRMGDDDGGTGTTVTDQGSGGNNGTLTNGPTFSSSVPS